MRLGSLILRLNLLSFLHGVKRRRQCNLCIERRAPGIKEIASRQVVQIKKNKFVSTIHISRSPLVSVRARKSVQKKWYGYSKMRFPFAYQATHLRILCDHFAVTLQMAHPCPCKWEICFLKVLYTGRLKHLLNIQRVLNWTSFTLPV